MHALHGVEVLRKPVVERRCDHPGRVDRELGADRGHDRLELRGEERRRRRARITYSGLMPSGSRTSERIPVSASWIAKANMPRRRGSESGTPGAPGLEHDLGVGRSWRSGRPEPSSCRRISR